MVTGHRDSFSVNWTDQWPYQHKTLSAWEYTVLSIDEEEYNFGKFF